MIIIMTILFALIGLIFMPLLIIWALNTLFRLNISYSFKPWLAVVILLFIFNSKWPNLLNHWSHACSYTEKSVYINR